jgi:FixJ family two-component response regulator
VYDEESVIAVSGQVGIASNRSELELSYGAPKQSQSAYRFARSFPIMKLSSRKNFRKLASAFSAGRICSFLAVFSFGWFHDAGSRHCKGPITMKTIARVSGRGEGLKDPKLRVFVVDDDPSVRKSLATLLSTQEYAVEAFASAAEYLEHVPPSGPACLILDIRLPGLDGPALQKQLTQEGRLEQIVFITGHGNIPMGISAMKRGAVDFLPKPFSDDELLSAVAQALARSADHWKQRGDFAECRARLAKLTPREFEVMRLVIAGLLNKQIAGELGASVRTIKTHRSRVMDKMGVISVAELVIQAQKAGISPASSRP